MEQALLERVHALHQESEALEERITFVDKQVSELTEFLGHLAAFESSSDPLLFSSLGKGVFVRTSLHDKTLLVDVGAGILVKKKSADVRAIIQGQLEGLRTMRHEAQSALQGYHAEFEALIAHVEGSK